MTQSLSGRKDPKMLKDHVSEMSKESGIDFKGDSDSVVDPQRLGKVIGREVSYENATHSADDQSVYDPNDLNSVEARLQELMKMKRK
jgi:DNA repair ATPase RecN